MCRGSRGVAEGGRGLQWVAWVADSWADSLKGKKHLCVTVCCIVLQCTAVCLSLLQKHRQIHSKKATAPVCCNELQCAAVCCSVLWYVALCCNSLQCVAVNCSESQWVADVLANELTSKWTQRKIQHLCVARCWNVFQCVANEPVNSLNKEKCTSVLQCVAVRYSKLQWVAVCCRCTADSLREGNSTCVHVLKEWAIICLACVDRMGALFWKNRALWEVHRSLMYDE